MAKVSRTYRIEQETADRIVKIAENEKITATEAVEAAIRMYFSEKYIEDTPRRAEQADSLAVSALVEQLAVKDGQLAKKDEQIARLTDAVLDGTKAVQGAQALHHETAQTLALESTGQKESRWLRLKKAWRG